MAVKDLLKRLSPAADRGRVSKARKAVTKAHSKDSLRAFSKLTHEVDGERRIISDPPLIVPVEDIEGAEGRGYDTEIRSLLDTYRGTLQGAGRWLIGRYEYIHMARKVVGVGSVGTRCWIVLLSGRDSDDPLFLQVKEAGESVLSPFMGKSDYDNEGERVVEGQWLMQAAGDPFLGWLNVQGFDGEHRDFYLRQLWDWKVSADVDSFGPRDLAAYGSACGWTLARAHARSGDAIAIGAYLGGSDSFERAMAAFAESYADQNERDYAALREAADSGRIPVEAGL
jgi:hypothetical protein